MKSISVPLICAAILIACSSPSKNGNTRVPDTLIGIWVTTEPDSLYLETIYYNNVSWTYTDEFGITKSVYQLDNDVIEKFYMDGTPFLNVKILKLTKDSLITFFEKQVIHSYRLNVQYDFGPIINGDANALDSYRRDLRKRRASWEGR